MENKLKNSRLFLSGPIDRVADDGIGWRKYLRDKIKENNIVLRVFDPCDKPDGLGCEIGVEKQKVKKLLEKGLWEEARDFTKIFRRYDLRGIDWCDFVIVKVDLNVHMCGTYDEIFTAYREHKPVLIIMGENQNKKDIPTWLLSYIKGPQDIFESEDEVVDYLIRINEGSIELDDRWVSIRDGI